MITQKTSQSQTAGNTFQRSKYSLYEITNLDPNLPFVKNPTSHELQCYIRASKLCKNILSLGRNLIFVAAINKMGQMIDMKLQNYESVKKFSKENWDMIFMQCRLQSSIMEDHMNILSDFKYAVIKRRYFTILVFPYSGGTILAGYHPSYKLYSLAKKISGIILKK